MVVSIWPTKKQGKNHMMSHLPLTFLFSRVEKYGGGRPAAAAYDQQEFVCMYVCARWWSVRAMDMLGDGGEWLVIGLSDAMSESAMSDDEWSDDWVDGSAMVRGDGFWSDGWKTVSDLISDICRRWERVLRRHEETLPRSTYRGSGRFYAHPFLSFIFSVWFNHRRKADRVLLWIIWSAAYGAAGLLPCGPWANYLMFN